jgi:hypothetical protein
LVTTRFVSWVLPGSTVRIEAFEIQGQLLGAFQVE